MDAKRIRRRAFWIGVRSVFDLSGRRTLRDMRGLVRAATPSAVESCTWTWQPVDIRGGSTTENATPGMYYDYTYR